MLLTKFSNLYRLTDPELVIFKIQDSCYKRERGIVAVSSLQLGVRGCLLTPPPALDDGFKLNLKLEIASFLFSLN